MKIWRLTILDQSCKGHRCHHSEEDQDVVGAARPHHVKASNASAADETDRDGVEGKTGDECCMSSRVNRHRWHCTKVGLSGVP